MANELARQNKMDAPETAEGATGGTRSAEAAGDAAQEQLKKLRSMFAVALNSAEHGLAVFDAEHRLTACNKRFAEMYGLPEALTQPGTPYAELEGYIPGPPKDTDAQAASAAADDEPFSYIIQRPDGRRVHVSRQPISDGGWVETHDYASDRRRAEQRINWLERHDPLTAVGNPMYFGEELENALQQLNRGIAFAIHWIDVDDFRLINDTYGHPVGYAVLKTIAERLVHTVRKGDLVARLGGDEFAVIQPGVESHAQAEMLAKRLLKAVNQPVEILGNSIAISVSIGVVVAPEHGTSSLELMKNIYLALYAAKAAGRHTVMVYDPEQPKQK